MPLPQPLLDGHGRGGEDAPRERKPPTAWYHSIMTVHRTQHRKSHNELGQAHELTFGCYRGYPFLARERVCRWLAEAIRQVRQELDMAVWAYVFMPNYVHLLVHFGRGEYDISQVLRQLKRPISRKALAFLRANAPEWLPKLRTQRGQKTEFRF